MGDLDLLTLPDTSAQGPAPSADTRLIIAGTVYAVDVAARLVQVSVLGSVLWLPALPGRYRVAEVAVSTSQGLARVLLDPVAGRPVLILGPVDPRAPLVAGTMTAAGASTCTLTLDGATHTVPYQAATYGALPAAVLVALDDWGVPLWVLGPSAIPDQSQVAPTPPSGGGSVVASAVVAPQWSGTWRVDRAAWDRWNTGDYGGRSDIYQGSGYGSGVLRGLACYGDQIVNLGATAITAATLRVRRNGPGGGTAALTVQGSPHGSQPAGSPTSSGATAATGAAGVGGWVSVDLPAAVREALRTGTAKGLVAVGGTYSGWGGTSTPGSMVIELTYTRSA